MLEEMLEKGSTLLISDVGCAALLCRAAMESAAMNVYVNTRLLRDRGRVTEIEARAETLTAGCSARAESSALSVKNRLNGGGAWLRFFGAPRRQRRCVKPCPPESGFFGTGEPRPLWPSCEWARGPTALRMKAAS